MARVAHDPAAEELQATLDQREILHVFNRPRADYDLRLARHDRRDERGDIGGVVLVVGVRVDDHVGAEL